MAVEVVNNEDGTITILKNSVKECDCSISGLIAKKAKAESILSDFDNKVAEQKAKMISDFEEQMARVKISQQAIVDEIDVILLKAVEAGCVLPE